MTSLRQTITDEYDRREAEAGGYEYADHDQIAHDIAEEMRISYEHVRDALNDHFALGPC